MNRHMTFRVSCNIPRRHSCSRLDAIEEEEEDDEADEDDDDDDR